ncbi:MAG TPA: bifunctional DNA-formamidopyrimidine glycosylase/DNA-(apurinic or apyrimidinic site) lyase [Pyrinomonadaceae bacterium]|jgi:formamidopyrimidine-DNA glycosylase|nr:bifunctional DNA-formamidopyrimidine glycosylase/DNA-(apurinic or apyrimidinic site) lyase [Pyrinomonadaceae bacterium]
MPELPEVELVARALDKLTTGRRILAAELLRPRLAPETAPAEFGRLLRQARIERVGRRGKHLLIELDEGLVLMVHLRMSGRFLYLPPEASLPKFTHAVFYLEDGQRLVFADQRHFGMMKLVARSRLYETKELRQLAPEPFSESFTPDYLHAALSRSRRTLKETLIDQRRVTGLGNIYAAEALFLARVNPFITASEFSKRRVPRLHRAILDIFTESLAHGAALEIDPENIDGSYYSGGGDAGGRWRVYDREGEPCPACKASIRRISQRGRSTYFCPRCQRR